MKILDWIFDKGELDFLPRAQVDAFLRDRFNQNLENVSVEPIFEGRTRACSRRRGGSTRTL